MIPFIDLKRQYQHEKKQIEQAIAQVLSSGQYLNGSQVNEFEEEFTSYLGIEEAIGVGSGTDAIALSLLSLGIDPGDEVIMSDNVYPSVFGILRAGAIPLPCDINPQTFNLDVKSLNKLKISKKTKAILFIHLYGNPDGVIEAAKFAKENNLFLIEDCAHAHGAKIEGKMVGTIGEIGVFSFYPTKNLGAFGNGGMMVTKSATLAKKMRFLKANGEKLRFISQKIGLSTQLDEIQAAILRVKLKSLEKNNHLRSELARYYSNKLKHLPIGLPFQAPYTQPAFLNFVITTSQRNQLQSYLTDHGILTQVHYPLPLHLQPSLKYLGFKRGDFPNAEKACQSVLSLPMYPYLTKKEVEIICQTIVNFFRQ